MPRLISKKRYQRLVEFERKWLARPAIIPDAKPPQELLDRLKSCEESNEGHELYRTQLEGVVLLLGKILDPKIKSVNDVLALAEKLKK
jgi:hypothetical protein